MAKDTEGTTPRVVPMPPPDKRCTHVGTTDDPNKRCGAWAVKGFTVCIYHGAATPLSKAAAKLRLLAMADVAFHVLLEAMEKAPWKERVQAAIAILDRAGYGPKSTVLLESADTRDLSNMSTEDLEREAINVLEELQRNKNASVIQQFTEMDVPGQPN